MKINSAKLTKGQTLNVSTKKNATGMTAVEMLGASQVEFVEVAETDPKYGSVLTVAFNGKVEKYNERFFTASN